MKDLGEETVMYWTQDTVFGQLYFDNQLFSYDAFREHLF